MPKFYKYIEAQDVDRVHQASRITAIPGQDIALEAYIRIAVKYALSRTSIPTVWEFAGMEDLSRRIAEGAVHAGFAVA